MMRGEKEEVEVVVVVVWSWRGAGREVGRKGKKER
jgi:hypothetical protein